jgi:hypothetical protein
MNTLELRRIQGQNLERGLLPRLRFRPCRRKYGCILLDEVGVLWWCQSYTGSGATQQEAMGQE